MAVLRGTDAECGTDSGRAGEQMGEGSRLGPAGCHEFKAVDGFGGPNQDGGSTARLFGGHVEHPVHAIDEVDIGAAGLTEHDLVPLRWPPLGVAAGVVRAAVGFGFDNLGAERAADEVRAQESDGAKANVLHQGFAKQVEVHVWILSQEKMPRPLRNRG